MAKNSIVKHTLMLILGPLLIAAVGAWFYLHGGRYVSTDNAYLKTEILTISSEVSGRVVELDLKDNTPVSEGQLLFKIDDQPLLIARARAEANLADTKADIEGLKAEYLNQKLVIAKAETELEFRKKELERMRKLKAQGSVSAAVYDQAEHDWDSAQSDLQNKQQGLQVLKARLLDPQQPVEAHPRYRQALAELEKARFDLSRVEVRAPVSGIVVNLSLHVGENVIAGAPILSLIDDSRIWLEANFKETDLSYLRPGQSAEVTIDTYPGQHWQARVASVTPATGAEFSLLPAQNSSGNWVKVVQRIMVKLEFVDSHEDLPLAAGMSAEVTVDTGHIRTLGRFE
ncbi:MAG: HlyD family secretion protein [Pseudomonadales bacterium]|nr:HlyD family secretion protein [Pseudomonadales bacterium]